MNRHALLDIFDGDTELMQEMIVVFLENFPAQLAAVREAVERVDSEKVERAAHALKGSVCIFDVPEVFEAALRMEDMGRTGDLTGSKETYALLDREIHILEAALNALETVPVS